MDDKNIPMVAHEYAMARFERTVQRLITALVIVVALLFATNIAWLAVFNSYEFTDVTVDSEDNGVANYMGAHASGEINNGESKSEDTNP